LLAGTDEAVEQALSLFHMRRQQGESQAASLAKRAGIPETPNKIRFQQKLGAWCMTEMMKAQNAGSASWAEKIEDQHKTILYALSYVRDPREIEGVLENIFLWDEACWITLSTAHKAKGLEADHVYLLRETFRRYQKRMRRDGTPIPVPQEELNVEYVAITRGKRTLTWVHLDGADA
jgi:superfamily I DNA/RNA helicase